MTRRARSNPRGPRRGRHRNTGSRGSNTRPPARNSSGRGGPGQGERFVVPALARQVARIATGQQEPTLMVGDIDVTRDFSDVRDVVRAYAAMLDRGQAGQTYNVCSGREVTIRSILRALCTLARVDPAIVQDSARLRPSEQRRMVADCQRLRADTGWEPAIPLETSLQQILDQFRTSQTP